jgi:hypothetical protein
MSGFKRRARLESIIIPANLKKAPVGSLGKAQKWGSKDKRTQKNAAVPLNIP